MKPVAVRNIERTDGATIGGLGTLGVATVHEAQGRSGLLEPYIRPIHLRAQAAGSAVTMQSGRDARIRQGHAAPRKGALAPGKGAWMTAVFVHGGLKRRRTTVAGRP